MSDSKRIIGKYKGKILTGEGTRKDGKKYCKYKATFEVGDKDWNFTIFTPWTKTDGTEKKGTSPEDLVEGDFYEILYSEYQTDGMKYPSKTANIFFHKKDVTEKNKELVSNDRNPFVFDRDTLKRYATAYFEKVPKDKQSKLHFLGTLHYTLAKQYCQDIVVLWEEMKNG